MIDGSIHHGKFLSRTAPASPAARGITLLVALLTLAFAGGCLIPPDKTLFTTTGPGWTVRQGQAIWRPGRQYPELAGEIVLAQNSNGCTSVQFTKTLLPVTLAQSTQTNWLIQFFPQRLGFGGRGRPPSRFIWLQLPAALAGQGLPAKLSFTRQADNGWRLENEGTGEFVEGFLSP